MAQNNEVVLAGRTYTTQAAAKRDAQSICARANSWLVGLDKAFFDDLVQIARPEKLAGTQIEGWRCEVGNCLLFKPRDGNEDTISWNKCIQRAFKSRINQHRVNVREAFRHAVRGQVDDFRSRNPCEHVGHDYIRGERFIELVKSFTGSSEYWKAIRPQDLLRCTVVGHRGNGYTFRDEAFRDRWAKFHADRAILRPETARDNLRGNRGFPRG